MATQSSFRVITKDETCRSVELKLRLPACLEGPPELYVRLIRRRSSLVVASHSYVVENVACLHPEFRPDDVFLLSRTAALVLLHLCFPAQQDTVRDILNLCSSNFPSLSEKRSHAILEPRYNFADGGHDVQLDTNGEEPLWAWRLNPCTSIIQLLPKYPRLCFAVWFLSVAVFSESMLVFKNLHEELSAASGQADQYMAVLGILKGMMKRGCNNSQICLYNEIQDMRDTYKGRPAGTVPKRGNDYKNCVTENDSREFLLMTLLLSHVNRLFYNIYTEMRVLAVVGDTPEQRAAASMFAGMTVPGSMLRVVEYLFHPSRAHTSLSVLHVGIWRAGKRGRRCNVAKNIIACDADREWGRFELEWETFQYRSSTYRALVIHRAEEASVTVAAPAPSVPHKPARGTSTAAKRMLVQQQPALTRAHQEPEVLVEETTRGGVVLLHPFDPIPDKLEMVKQQYWRTMKLTLSYGDASRGLWWKAHYTAIDQFNRVHMPRVFQMAVALTPWCKHNPDRTEDGKPCDWYVNVSVTDGSDGKDSGPITPFSVVVNGRECLDVNMWVDIDESLKNKILRL